jgi:hypothetical protein
MLERFKVAKSIGQLSERLDSVERRLTSLQLEWMDTLDRLKSMVGRIVKDRARAEAAREEIGAGDRGGLETETPVSSFTANQERINAQILARRNRLKGTQ